MMSQFYLSNPCEYFRAVFFHNRAGYLATCKSLFTIHARCRWTDIRTKYDLNSGAHYNAR